MLRHWWILASHRKLRLFFLSMQQSKLNHVSKRADRKIPWFSVSHFNLPANVSVPIASFNRTVTKDMGMATVTKLNTDVGLSCLWRDIRWQWVYFWMYHSIYICLYIYIHNICTHTHFVETLRQWRVVSVLNVIIKYQQIFENEVLYVSSLI